MPMEKTSNGPILSVCLNPVIQKTIVFNELLKGEVNRAKEHRVDASGKGINVARVLTQRGERAVHLTQAGGASREWFLSLCAADGLDVRWVESGSSIRFCYTVIDRADRSATELVEEADEVSPKTGDLLVDEFERLLPGCSALVVSGTKAAGFRPSIMGEIAARAAAAGKPIVLDIKGKDLLEALPHRPLIVKPNLAELLATWPMEEGSADDEAAAMKHVERVASDIRQRYGSLLVVTRGAKAVWFHDGERLREHRPRPCEALNPTGSGDAFTAGLTATLVGGGTISEAVAEGSRMGSLNAERLKPGSIL
jgi:1-phosphofructokinase family hexose kinase